MCFRAHTGFVLIDGFARCESAPQKRPPAAPLNFLPLDYSWVDICRTVGCVCVSLFAQSLRGHLQRSAIRRTQQYKSNVGRASVSGLQRYIEACCRWARADWLNFMHHVRKMRICNFISHICVFCIFFIFKFCRKDLSCRRGICIAFEYLSHYGALTGIIIQLAVTLSAFKSLTATNPLYEKMTNLGQFFSSFEPFMLRG